MASSGLRQKAHSTRHSTSRAKRGAYRVEVGSAACKPRVAVRMRWWAVAAVYGEHPAARRLQLLCKRHLWHVGVQAVSYRVAAPVP